MLDSILNWASTASCASSLTTELIASDASSHVMILVDDDAKPSNALSNPLESKIAPYRGTPLTLVPAAWKNWTRSAIIRLPKPTSSLDSSFSESPITIRIPTSKPSWLRTFNRMLPGITSSDNEVRTVFSWMNLASAADFSSSSLKIEAATLFVAKTISSSKTFSSPSSDAALAVISCALTTEAIVWQASNTPSIRSRSSSSSTRVFAAVSVAFSASVCSLKASSSANMKHDASISLLIIGPTAISVAVVLRSWTWISCALNATSASSTPIADAESDSVSTTYATHISMAVIVYWSIACSKAFFSAAALSAAKIAAEIISAWTSERDMSAMNRSSGDKALRSISAEAANSALFISFLNSRNSSSTTIVTSSQRVDDWKKAAIWFSASSLIVASSFTICFAAVFISEMTTSWTIIDEINIHDSIVTSFKVLFATSKNFSDNVESKISSNSFNSMLAFAADIFASNKTSESITSWTKTEDADSSPKYISLAISEAAVYSKISICSEAITQVAIFDAASANSSSALAAATICAAAHSAAAFSAAAFSAASFKATATSALISAKARITTNRISSNTVTLTISKEILLWAASNSLPFSVAIVISALSSSSVEITHVTILATHSAMSVTACSAAASSNAMRSLSACSAAICFARANSSFAISSVTSFFDICTICRISSLLKYAKRFAQTNSSAFISSSKISPALLIINVSNSSEANTQVIILETAIPISSMAFLWAASRAASSSAAIRAASANSAAIRCASRKSEVSEKRALLATSSTTSPNSSEKIVAAIEISADSCSEEIWATSIDSVTSITCIKTTHVAILAADSANWSTDFSNAAALIAASFATAAASRSSSPNKCDALSPASFISDSTTSFAIISNTTTDKISAERSRDIRVSTASWTATRSRSRYSRSLTDMSADSNDSLHLFSIASSSASPCAALIIPSSTFSAATNQVIIFMADCAISSISSITAVSKTEDNRPLVMVSMTPRDDSSAFSNIATSNANCSAASSSAFRICEARSLTAFSIIVSFSNWIIKSVNWGTNSLRSSLWTVSTAELKESEISGSLISSSMVSTTNSATSSSCRSEIMLTKLTASSRSPNASVIDCISTLISIKS